MSVKNRKVSLSELEIRICRHLAKARHMICREEGVENKRKGDQSDEETDFEGICGEFAFCKLFNIYPDLTISVKSAQYNTDKGDAVLKNGLKVDVKTTKYMNGRLLAATWKNPSVDLYALMIGQAPNYEFKGFMWQNELLKDERIGNLGCGEVHMAEQGELF